MVKHLIVLPDGTEISSGVDSEIAIMHTSATESVNSQTELTIGSVCAAMVELKIFTPHGDLNIDAGTEFELYQLHEEIGKEPISKKIGLFTAEKPIRTSANTLTVTAYDRVSWLDKDLTEWVMSLEAWPYAVEDLALMVAHECGTGLCTEMLMNGSYQVQRFGGSGITGRKIMQWIAEISATFCRANSDGGIVFERYRSTSTVLSSADTFSTTLSDYQTARIDRVQIRLSDDDIGVIYPDVAGVTYSVTGNYLLTATDSAALDTVVQNIYSAIKDVSYTPGTVVIAHNPDICAGDIITVQDLNGRTAIMYVMTKTTKGRRDTLECTGSPSRDSSTAVHEESFRTMNAKMLEMKKDISGLSVRASESETRIEDNRAYTDQKITEVTIAAEGLATTVEDVREMAGGFESRFSSIQQDADSISLRVESIEANGVDKVNTGFGLTVNESAVVIARDGAELENRLDETGMYIIRNDGTVVMQAAADGVITQNLNVRGYFDIFGMLRKQAWTDEQGRPCVATLWTEGN